MQTTDSVTVVRDLMAAVKEQDVQELMEFFDDGALLRIEPSLPGSVIENYRGKERIQNWWQEFFANHGTIDAGNYRASGSQVSFDATISSDRFAAIGVDPVQANVQASLDGNTVRSLTITYTPESVKRIQEAVAAQGQPA